MSEVRVAGNPTPMQGDQELVNALISKTVDNGTALNDLKVTGLSNLAETRENSRLIGDVVKGLDNQPALKAILEEIKNRIDKNLHDNEELQNRHNEELNRIWMALSDNYKKESAQTELKVTLIDKLQENIQLFEKPHHKNVHYTHHLGRPLLVLGVMLILPLAEFFYWNGLWAKAEKYQEGDIQWRNIELTKDPVVLEAVQKTRSMYRMGPEQFRADVVEEENRRQELFEREMQRNEKDIEIHELEKKEKKR